MKTVIAVLLAVGLGFAAGYLYLSRKNAETAARNSADASDWAAEKAGLEQQLADARRQTSADQFCEALTRATARLEELENDYAATAQSDARKLEDSLTGVERMLDETIRKTVSDDDLKSISAEIVEQLKPYKRHMDKAAYAETNENLLRKRLRELLGVPRLSLFFL